MNEGKVVIPREVADAIEYARKTLYEYADEDMIKCAFNPDYYWMSEKLKALNDINPMTLVRALVNGYVIECTPHEEG